MIKLANDQNYKYDSVYRFYGWEHAEELKPIKVCGFSTLGDFYLACLRSWCVDTCSAAYRIFWRDDNPSAGHCTITSVIVREIFGGDILALPLLEGGFHYFNKINGKIVDLASEQFGKNALLEYDESLEINPSALLEKPEKYERYLLLKDKLSEVAGFEL